MNDLYIMHYGVGHDKGGHSGRYPWGSGKNPYGGQGTKNPFDKKDSVKKGVRNVGLALLTGGVSAGIQNAYGKTGGATADLNTIYGDAQMGMEINAQILRDKINKAIKNKVKSTGDPSFKLTKNNIDDIPELKTAIQDFKKTDRMVRDDAIKGIKRVANEFDLSSYFTSDSSSKAGPYGRVNVDQARDFLSKYANQNPKKVSLYASYPKLKDVENMSDMQIINAVLNDY